MVSHHRQISLLGEVNILTESGLIDLSGIVFNQLAETIKSSKYIYNHWPQTINKDLTAKDHEHLLTTVKQSCSTANQ
jgi:hypothetical protein